MRSFSFGIPTDIHYVSDEIEEDEDDIKQCVFPSVEEYEQNYLSEYFTRCSLHILNGSIYLIQPCKSDKNISIFYKYVSPDEEFGKRIVKILTKELEGLDGRNIELASSKVRRMIGGPSSLGFLIHDDLIQLSDPDKYGIEFNYLDNRNIEVRNVDRKEDINNRFWSDVEESLSKTDVSINYNKRIKEKTRIFEY